MKKVQIYAKNDSFVMYLLVIDRKKNGIPMVFLI